MTPPLRRSLVALLLAAVTTAPAVAAAPAPRLTLQSYARLRTPLPYPYDEKADAARQVDAARARARRSGKRLLLDFGGNWCPDCRILAATIEQTELRRFIDRHFEFVMVDIGGKDRGEEPVGRVPLRPEGRGRSGPGGDRSHERPRDQPRPHRRSLRRAEHEPAGPRRLCGALGSLSRRRDGRSPLTSREPK